MIDERLKEQMADAMAFLPNGAVKTALQALFKHYGVSQSKIAKRISIDGGTLSRRLDKLKGLSERDQERIYQILEAVAEISATPPRSPKDVHLRAGRSEHIGVTDHPARDSRYEYRPDARQPDRQRPKACRADGRKVAGTWQRLIAPISAHISNMNSPCVFCPNRKLQSLHNSCNVAVAAGP